jgi:hydrogenase expression/formation protein HypC
MCIGLPMEIVEAGPGVAVAQRRGRRERIDCRLVEHDGAALASGQWVLVFNGAARERLDAVRAAEIDATLDLLDAALGGDAARAGAAPGFSLPSALDADALARLTGQRSSDPVAVADR